MKKLGITTVLVLTLAAVVLLSWRGGGYYGRGGGTGWDNPPASGTAPSTPRYYAPHLPSSVPAEFSSTDAAILRCVYQYRREFVKTMDDWYGKFKNSIFYNWSRSLSSQNAFLDRVNEEAPFNPTDPFSFALPAPAPADDDAPAPTTTPGLFSSSDELNSYFADVKKRGDKNEEEALRCTVELAERMAAMAREMEGKAESDFARLYTRWLRFNSENRTRAAYYALKTRYPKATYSPKYLSPEDFKNMTSDLPRNRRSGRPPRWRRNYRGGFRGRGPCCPGPCRGWSS